MESIVGFAAELSKLSLWGTVASIILVTGPLFLLSMFVRRLRPTAFVAMYICSFGFGLTLWLSSIVITYGLWGGRALIVGLIFVGVGIIPFCMIGELLTASWPELAFTLFLAACSVTPKLVLAAGIAWLERREEVASASE